MFLICTQEAIPEPPHLGSGWPRDFRTKRFGDGPREQPTAQPEGRHLCFRDVCRRPLLHALPPKTVTKTQALIDASYRPTVRGACTAPSVSIRESTGGPIPRSDWGRTTVRFLNHGRSSRPMVPDTPFAETARFYWMLFTRWDGVMTAEAGTRKFVAGKAVVHGRRVKPKTTYRGD